MDLKIKKYWNELYVLKESDPFDSRSDKEFCEENNLNYGNFRNWKSEHRRAIYDEVNKRREEYKSELRTKARKALAQKLDKDTNALKLAFQLLGDLVEKTEIKAEHYTQEDLKRRINDLLQNISNRKKTWEVSSGAESNGEEARKDGSGVAAEQPNDKEASNINDGERRSEPGKDTPVS